MAPSYSKPPVREALIDIRVNPLPNTSLAILESLREQLPQYPKKKTTYQWEASWEFQEANVTSHQKSHGPVGFHFISDDEKQIVQYRLDGFTLNRIKLDPFESWVGWPAICEEAKQAWDLYARALEIKEVTALSVRYINNIVIPSPLVELEEYFTASPKIPTGIPNQFETFFNRVVIPYKNEKAKAVIILTPSQEALRDAVGVILDIDVHWRERREADTKAIWETLDTFRRLKNTIFEASLSPKAKELFV